MLANVQQTTIRPIIEASVAEGALVHTDEYDVYARLQDWSYGHKTVCHGHGEYARDDDGDGFCEVHVNTAEGFWSLLRSWLRPHRGISQEKLPAYLGFFQLVHNARRRGNDPPPLKWSTLRHVFGQDGGPRCRARDTRPRRSSPSCAS